MGTVENLIDEHFVPIVGHEAYEVSSYGRVVHANDGEELKQFTISGTQETLLYVVLQTNDSQDAGYLVHYLVAQAFFADYDEKSSVEFINGDSSDCSIRNLTLKPKV